MRYLLLAVLLVSCSTQKHYSQNDYSFYDAHFTAAPNVRTDGVYINLKDSTAYKFYHTGQSNLILHIDSNYVDAFNQRRKSTLFEGYYKVKGDSIVIQSVSVPRRLFVYNYGFITPDSLIIVSETISGKGKFKDKYFTSKYRAYYGFRADTGKFALPNW